jgi:hypothetical protein
MQQAQNNKEESIALAKHARDMTFKLFDPLKSCNHLDSLKPSIEHFVK